MILFWLLVLLLVVLTFSFGIVLYLPGLLLSRLTRRPWFESPGAYLIGAGILLIYAAVRVHEELASEPGHIHERASKLMQGDKCNNNY